MSVHLQEEGEEDEPASTPAPKPRVSDSRAYEGISTYFAWMRERNDFSPLEVLQIKTFVEKNWKNQGQFSETKNNCRLFYSVIQRIMWHRKF